MALNLDDRNLRLLRELQKLPDNRNCFDCSSRAPSYCNLLNFTFICEQCAGLHREMAHRVKSVSASRFSVEELTALREGGNQRALAAWMFKWNPEIDRFPDLTDVNSLRQHLRQKYLYYKWANPSMSHTRPAVLPPEQQQLRSSEDRVKVARRFSLNIPPRRADSSSTSSSEPREDEPAVFMPRLRILTNGASGSPGLAALERGSPVPAFESGRRYLDHDGLFKQSPTSPKPCRPFFDDVVMQQQPRQKRSPITDKAQSLRQLTGVHDEEEAFFVLMQSRVRSNSMHAINTTANAKINGSPTSMKSSGKNPFRTESPVSSPASGSFPYNSLHLDRYSHRSSSLDARVNPAAARMSLPVQPKSASQGYTGNMMIASPIALSSNNPFAAMVAARSAQAAAATTTPQHPTSTNSHTSFVRFSQQQQQQNGY